MGKRLLDLGVSVTVLAAAPPLLAAVAVAVRRAMGAPVLFRQERAGQHGRPFELVKFRTMRHARPHEEGFAFDGDRLTSLGRLLRSTSIDELPSLWNVVTGDLSLVGPRPLPVLYLPRYSPDQARRHEVKPGITGWAQVNGRNRLSWREKFELDVWYVEHRCLLLDLRILAMTVGKVLSGDGISQDAHATMTEFTGPEAVGERHGARGEPRAERQ
ncbi:MAG: sugar transferase [Acidimicrobiales bacterium]